MKFNARVALKKCMLLKHLFEITTYSKTICLHFQMTKNIKPPQKLFTYYVNAIIKLLKNIIKID